MDFQTQKRHLLRNKAVVTVQGCDFKWMQWHNSFFLPFAGLPRGARPTRSVPFRPLPFRSVCAAGGRGLSMWPACAAVGGGVPLVRRACALRSDIGPRFLFRWFFYWESVVHISGNDGLCKWVQNREVLKSLEF